tara:strand:+ start:543 stop:677 length:135 start_codon:yes stop_codon:yes gene_type:complete
LGIQRAEAIVVTGQGTGKETPIDRFLVSNFMDVVKEVREYQASL